MASFIQLENANAVGVGEAAGRAATVRRRDGILERILSNELVLYDPVCDRAYLLNHVAAAIWHLCDGTRTDDQVVTDVAATFRSSIDAIESGVRSAIQRLRESRLVADVLPNHDARAATGSCLPRPRGPSDDTGLTG